MPSKENNNRISYSIPHTRLLKMFRKRVRMEDGNKNMGEKISTSWPIHCLHRTIHQAYTFSNSSRIMEEWSMKKSSNLSLHLNLQCNSKDKRQSLVNLSNHKDHL